MSTTPVTPASSTLSKILTGLTETNSIVSLGITVAGVVIPLVKGLVADIKKINTPQGTVAYQIVIAADATEIDGDKTMEVADIAAVNAYLASIGAPLVPVPAPDPSAPPAAAEPTPAA